MIAQAVRLCLSCLTVHGEMEGCPPPRKPDVVDMLQQVYCRKCERIHHPKDPCDFTPEPPMQFKCRFVYMDMKAGKQICSIEANNLDDADAAFQRMFVQDPAECSHISVQVEENGKPFTVV